MWCIPGPPPPTVAGMNSKPTPYLSNVYVKDSELTPNQGGYVTKQCLRGSKDPTWISVLGAQSKGQGEAQNQAKKIQKLDWQSHQEHVGTNVLKAKWW